MIAYISYSLNDHDQYILTLLAGELNSKGMIIKQSSDFHSNMSSVTMHNIHKAELFIGLISGVGMEKNRVINEYNYAIRSKTPSILLIENTVELPPNFRGNYIVFDRYYPDSAIQQLKHRINNAKRKNNSDAAAWVLGGAALLAIIGLLANDD